MTTTEADELRVEHALDQVSSYRALTGKPYDTTHAECVEHGVRAVLELQAHEAPPPSDHEAGFRAGTGRHAETDGEIAELLSGLDDPAEESREAVARYLAKTYGHGEDRWPYYTAAVEEIDRIRALQPPSPVGGNAEVEGWRWTKKRRGYALIYKAEGIERAVVHRQYGSGAPSITWNGGEFASVDEAKAAAERAAATSRTDGGGK